MKSVYLPVQKLRSTLTKFLVVQSMSNFKVKVTRSKLQYHVNGLVTSKTHMCKMESPILLESYGQG